jgi:hypothetical protein
VQQSQSQASGQLAGDTGHPLQQGKALLEGHFTRHTKIVPTQLVTIDGKMQDIKK